jgi:hypothetical protein
MEHFISVAVLVASLRNIGAHEVNAWFFDRLQSSMTECHPLYKIAGGISLSNTE